MTTPENITHLGPNQIFCFGSNLAGRHGAGAAKQALKWGAIYGQGIGRAGQTYAIPTKDARIRTLPLWEIEQHVMRFLMHARDNPTETFLVTQIGCGLAGYTPKEIAPAFRSAPSNVILPASFLI